MLFNSYSFLVFFPIVVLIYFVCPRRFRGIWLLITSYYFYMSWNPRFAILIGISTLITFASGLMIEKCKRISPRVIVAGSVISNLLILGFFKYFIFSLNVCKSFFALFHIYINIPHWDILLPVGISFYTFQALSYTIDVYRGDVKPEHSLINYALFVSFFPQLVAGPIERSGNLLNQIRKVQENVLWKYDRIIEGLILIVWGYFLKVVVADRIAILVDTIFNNYTEFSGGIIFLLGAVGFAFQIYGDFAGYSTIAIGTAKILGFELMENFNTPYFSQSVGEFWHRWHISLSTWLRDYVYIPLGGNRKGRILKYRNIIITFLVSGIWHGAGFHFVVWGLLHGIYQVCGDLTRRIRQQAEEKLKLNKEVASYKIGKILVTFVLVDFAWIFFRAGSLTIALDYIRRMFRGFLPENFSADSILSIGFDNYDWWILVVSLLIVLFVSILRYVTGNRIEKILIKQNLWFRWIVILILLFMIIIFGIYGPDYTSSEFIYFQF